MKRNTAKARICAAVVAVTTTIFFTGSTAAGQPRGRDQAEAAERFQKGVELYEAGDVRASFIEFKRAYEALPNYQLLYNIAQVAAELKEYVDAYNYFRQYIRDGGGRIDYQRRKDVKQQISQLEGYLATIEVVVSVAGAEISIDGVVVGRSPMREPVVVSAGRRNITVNRQGYSPWERNIDLAGRVSETIKADLISLVVPERPRRGFERDDFGSRGEDGRGTAFWATATATTILALGAGYLAYQTVEAQDEYELQLATVPNRPQVVTQAGEDLRRLALVTDISLGLVAVGLVSSIVLSRRSRGRKEPRALRFKVSPKQVAVVGEWRY